MDFSTSTHIYAVIFTMEIYEPYLNDFPKLLTHGYEFSFFRRQYIKQKKKNNILVRNTIFKIIESHFKEYGVETVLLYRCDTFGGLEKARAEAFDSWYTSEDCYLNDFLIKESLEVVLPQEDGSQKTFYIGYIAHKQNPELEDLQKEFSLFGYHLVFLDKS